MNATVEDLTFRHSNSDRVVPVRRYSAQGTARGWILFSVGFGGDRNGYAFFARAWQAMGLTTFVVEHVGSNLEVLRSLPQKRRAERNAEVVRRVGDPVELRARPQDLVLVWDHLWREFEGLPLGLGGHSYGSYTVLACAGLEPRLVKHGVQPLPAESYLVISPQPPGMVFEAEEFTRIDRSTLVMTGTRDDLLSGESGYRERVAAYESLPEEHRGLVVFQDFEHMDFAGVGLNLSGKLAAMKAAGELWWRSTLLNDGIWPGELQASVASEVLARCE